MKNQNAPSVRRLTQIIGGFTVVAVTAAIGVGLSQYQSPRQVVSSQSAQHGGLVAQSSNLSSEATFQPKRDTMADIGSFVGRYVLVSSDNSRACGSLDNQLVARIQASIDKGEDLGWLKNEPRSAFSRVAVDLDGARTALTVTDSFTYVGVNAGAQVQEAYEQDPDKLSFEREARTEPGAFFATEKIFSKGSEVATNSTTMKLHEGKLVVDFHQNSLNERLALSGSTHCEWLRVR